MLNCECVAPIDAPVYPSASPAGRSRALWSFDLAYHFEATELEDPNPSAAQSV